MLSIKNIRDDSNNSFKVFIRVRPLNQYQQRLTSSTSYLSYDQRQVSVKIGNQKLSFNFDKIHQPAATQQQIFETVADEIVDNAFMGINGTIFCYGQTSSGKTHTIVGQFSTNCSENQGLIPKALRQVIQRKNTKIDNIKESNLDIRIKISMVQIYNQKVMDLFDCNKRDLKLRQNKKQGVFIQNVTQKYIATMEESMNFVRLGLQNRTVGRTNLNAYSSRSHMVFTITVSETNFQTRQAKSAKITLTDLAGSQKISKTGVEGKMLIQARKINTSLLTLGKVIHALSETKTTHVPYRDSKLTRLLQQSVGGNSLTHLIINVSPYHKNVNQTVTSLRFGSRARLIKNKPKVNKQYTVQELLTLLQKAQLKIRHQMRIIEQLQQQKGYGSTKNLSLKINSGYVSELLNEKPLTMHMIGDDQQFDDGSSVGSHSVIKSVASHQDNCHGSSLEQPGVFFNRTSDFSFQALSVRKKLHEPNLRCSKSMRAIPTMGQYYDDQQLDQLMFYKRQQPSVKKAQKAVDKIVINQDSEDEGSNGIIYEENEQAREQSLKNSVGLNFQLPQQQTNKRTAQSTSNWKYQMKPPHNQTVIKLSDNQSTSDYTFLNTSPQGTNRQLDGCLQDHQKHKQNGIQQIRQEIKGQLKQRFMQQLKEQQGLQMKQQTKEQIKQSIQDQDKLNVEKHLMQQITTLNNKIQNMAAMLKATQAKFQQVKKRQEQNQRKMQQQKQTIKTKDVHIVGLKEKYKAKKYQINKEINKLKSFWQVVS